MIIRRIDYKITKPKANNVSDLNTPEDKLNWIFTAFDQVFIQRIIHSEFSVFSDFLICYLNSCICVCTTSLRSPHLSQDGGGSIDVEEIRDIVVGLFRFSTSLLKESSRLIKGFHWTKSFEYEPQTNDCSNTWNTKRQRDWFLFYADITALFILTRLAGIEEDEDLLTACVSDVRSVNKSLDTWTMLY